MKSSAQSLAPIPRAPVRMHHCNNPDVVGLFNEDDPVRKFLARMSSCRRVKFPAMFWMGTRLAKQPFQFEKKTLSKPGGYFRIVADCFCKLLVRLGMQRIVHRPAIFRARARDFSTGTPLTLPDSISAIRRSISVFQAAATDGSSAPDRAIMMRSINSATTSSGNSRVSSTICSSVIGMNKYWHGNRFLARAWMPNSRCGTSKTQTQDFRLTRQPFLPLPGGECCLRGRRSAEGELYSNFRVHGEPPPPKPGAHWNHESRRILRRSADSLVCGVADCQSAGHGQSNPLTCCPPVHGKEERSRRIPGLLPFRPQAIRVHLCPSVVENFFSSAANCVNLPSSP